MSNKTYLTSRTEYLLQKAIDPEIQRIKLITENGLSDIDINTCCAEIGILVALKNQAKKLIKEL